MVVGAQAVYLRTGLNDIAIAPFTTDGDLALDPTLLAEEPLLERAMEDAGFRLIGQDGHRGQPGMWLSTEQIDGVEMIVPVDLMVPAGALAGGRHRGARLDGHGNRAARQTLGLEAALVDHDAMTITALDPHDDRAQQVEVAGVAALIVARAHKIHERTIEGRNDRMSDKDAAGVYRMSRPRAQTTLPRR